MLRASVVICTRNRPTDLLECVESILSQTRKVEELIVVYDVDERDLDLEGPILKRLRAATIGYRTRASGGYGLTRARNLGAKMASGDVVFFVDDDVVLARDYVDQILRVYEADASSRVGGVGGRVSGERPSRLSLAFGRLFCLASLRLGMVLPSGSVTRPGDFSHMLEVEALSGCNMSYRLRVLKEFSFDEWYRGYGNGEDVDFSFRVSKRYSLMLTPSASLQHKHSELSRPSKDEFAYTQLRNHCYFFGKNMPRSNRHRLCFALSVVGLGLLNVLKFLRRPTRSNLDLVVGTLLWLRDAIILGNWPGKHQSSIGKVGQCLDS